VSESIRSFTKKVDPGAKSMYDDGGRARSAHRIGRMSDDYHSYGQQLGWNGLFVAAGEFLGKYPVTDDSYDDNPWPDWLTGELLTRDDGLWLADGVDPTPSGSQINLLERGEKELAITGKRKTLLLALGVDKSIGTEILVEGSWTSPDGIGVRVSSALVKPENSSQLVSELMKEEPFRVWLPTRHDVFSERGTSKKSNYEEWIVSPSCEGRLDGHDPLGSSVAMSRAHFTEEIATRWQLGKNDAFGREWHLPDGRVVARSEAWGCGSAYEDRERSSGQRLRCSTDFLRGLLKETCRQLLLLIKLERYEKESSNHMGQFSHTIAIVTINEALKLRFHRGAVNKIHKNTF